MVNTAIAVAMARAIVVQYHVACFEKTYSFADAGADAGVDGPCLVKCRRSSFSSSPIRSVDCSGGMSWCSCIRAISCFAVSGFSCFAVWMMRSLTWFFAA